MNFLSLIIICKLMGSGASINLEDTTRMMKETDPVKQKAASEKSFKSKDANHDGELNKKEIMTLADAFWKAIPKEMLSKMKLVGLKEGDTKDYMDEVLLTVWTRDLMVRNRQVSKRKKLCNPWYKHL